MEETQRQELERGYAARGPSVVLGAPLLAGAPARGLPIGIGLASLTRHGLIAGATGTGKTRTLQLLAGQLSAAGVPSLVADVKGDLTGLAAPADGTDPRIAERVAELGLPWAPAAHPVDLLSLSGRLGRPLRATVRSFGPILLARVLDLNATQTAVLAVAFRAAEDRGLRLDSLDDLRAVLGFLSSDEGEPVLRALGGVSPASLGVILRALVLLEGEGAGGLFGLPELDVTSLLRTDEAAGTISLLELSDVVRSPRLHSTFMLWLLVRLYDVLPEVGDLPRPKLAVFLDEAHLLFDDAPEPLLDQIEQTVRLIRSKGVAVVFVTQAPTDVPAAVLAQLGSRVQHALRAFTPDDEAALRRTARTFPRSRFVDAATTLTSLAIGEALVTALDDRGVPTPLAVTRLLPPDSSMAPLDDEALAALRARSGGAAEPTGDLRVEGPTGGPSRPVAPSVAPPAPEPRSTPAEEREREQRARRAEREAEQRAARERRALERALAARERAAVRRTEALLRAGTRIITSRQGQRAIGGLLRGLLRRR